MTYFDMAGLQTPLETLGIGYTLTMDEIENFSETENCEISRWEDEGGSVYERPPF